MNNKLKVGQSFEVVEVLQNRNYHINLFKIGGHTIKSSGNRWNHTLANGYKWECALEKSDLNFNHGVWMTDYEVKPIGKLTITKLK